MLILSIDPGVINLGYCILDVPETLQFSASGEDPQTLLHERAQELLRQSTVIHWECANILQECGLKGKTKSYTIEKLVTILVQWLKKTQDSRPIPDLIFIESQPVAGRGGARNLKSKTLSHVLQTYYAMQGCQNICFVHALTKMKLTKPVAPRLKGKQRYTATKKAAIQACAELIKVQPASLQQMYAESKKRDDLADSLLMAISSLLSSNYFQRLRAKQRSN